MNWGVFTAGIFNGASMFITTAGGYYLTAANDDSLFDPDTALIVGMILGASAALVNYQTTYETIVHRTGPQFKKARTGGQEVIPALMGVSVALATAAWLNSFSEAFNEEMDIRNPAIEAAIIVLGVAPCAFIWGLGAWLFIRHFCVSQNGVWQAVRDEYNAIKDQVDALSFHQKSATAVLGVFFIAASLISSVFSGILAWESLVDKSNEWIATGLITITTISGLLFFIRSSMVAAIEISKKSGEFSKNFNGFSLISIILFALNATSSSLPSLNGASILGAGPAGQGVGFGCAFLTSLAVNNGHKAYNKSISETASSAAC